MSPSCKRYYLCRQKKTKQTDTHMKPYIICHMMASLDGRIDCAMTEQIDDTNSYYDALASLQCDATLEGKTTLAMHYAQSGRFVPEHPEKTAGRQLFKAFEADKYAVGVDTLGTLLWDDDTEDLFGRPLVMILSEQASEEYLEYLRTKGISYITAGTGRIDLAAAVDLLRTEFGIQRLAVVGGGHINGSFLAAGLLDEVSMMYGPGIDGRKGMAAAFDGIDDAQRRPTLLRLTDVSRMGDTVWMRYRFGE